MATCEFSALAHSSLVARAVIKSSNFLRCRIFPSMILWQSYKKASIDGYKWRDFVMSRLWLVSFVVSDVRYLVSQRDLCVTLRKTFRDNVNEAGEGSSPAKLFALEISWFRTPDSCFPRPTKYVDLLSDDGVNRTVLHWLKLWDGVVFGNKMRDKAPVEKPKWQNQEDWLRYQRFQEPDYDERGFPFKKVSSYVSSVYHNSPKLSSV